MAEKIYRKNNQDEQMMNMLLQRRRDMLASEEEANDPLEKEADNVGAKVASGETINTEQLSSTGIQNQGKTEEQSAQMEQSISGSLAESKGGGEQMEDGVKSEMEESFGTNLGEVKIHTDSAANQMSEDINAKAFTHGNDIYFKDGNYDPSSKEGKELLGHELAHTQQQGKSVNRKIQRKLDYVDFIRSIALRTTKLFGGKQIYLQEFTKEFEDGVPYMATLTARTEYWISRPMPPIFEVEGGEAIESQPLVYFYREFSLTLKSGNKLDFAIYGATTVNMESEDYLDDEFSILDIEDFMNEFDRPRWFAGSKSTGLGGREGLNFSKSKSTGSMNQSLDHSDYWQLARVYLSPIQQYNFMIGLIESLPQTNGWLKDKLAEKEPDPTDESPEKVPKKSKNELIVMQDGKEVKKDLSLEDLAKLANELRLRRNYSEDGDDPILDSNTEIVTIKFNDQLISKDQLKNMFFITLKDAIDDEIGVPLERVLVYKIEGGYFARQVLTPEEGRAIWLKLDEVDDPENLASWDVKEKFGLPFNGTFVKLITTGVKWIHEIDINYYKGREFLKQNKDKLNRTITNSENDENQLGYIELGSLDQGELFKIYIRAEMDRPPEDAVYFRSILDKDGSSINYFLSFQHELGRIIYKEVRFYAKEYAYRQVADVAKFMKLLSEDRQALEMQLILLPAMKKADRRSIIQSFGFDHDAIDNLDKIFSDPTKASQIVMGVEVDDYSMEDIVSRVTETSTELWDLSTDILSGEVDVLSIGGVFGAEIRRHAYQELGFTELNPWEFPHHDEASSDYSSSTAHQFSNTAEQLYAQYTHSYERLVEIITISIIVVLGVILSLASLGIGIYAAAAAIGAESTGLAMIFAGITFTLLSEAALQLAGMGTLDRDKDWWGVDELFKEMIINVLTFMAFGAIGKILQGAHIVLRLTTVGILFAAYGLAMFYTEHGRLPEGDEWINFAYENALAFVLFEVGGRMARNAFLELKTNGTNRFGKRMSARFESLQSEIAGSQKKIAKLSTSENKNSEAQLELTEKYKEQLEKLDELFAKYGEKLDSGWVLTEQNGKKLGKTEVNQRRKFLSEQIQTLKDAIFLHKTGLKQVIGLGETLFYKGDKASAKLIKQKHSNRGETVTGPDKNGIMVATTKNNKRLTYIPDSNEGASQFQKEILANETFEGAVRTTPNGVLVIEGSKLPELIKMYENNNGSFQKVGGSDVFLGEMVREGKTIKAYYVTEESLFIADDALKLEQSSPGSGMSLIKASLRGSDAAQGLKDYIEVDWKGLSEGQQVYEVWKLEQKGKTEGKSLNTIFEERKASIENRELSDSDKAIIEFAESKGVTEVKKLDGRWTGTNADGEQVFEFEVGAHGELIKRGSNNFLQSHHGIQDLWGRDVFNTWLKEVFGQDSPLILNLQYKRNRCPAINLRDSRTDNPHYLVNKMQNSRRDGISGSKYSDMREYIREDLQQSGVEVPEKYINELIGQSDQYFGDLYNKIMVELIKTGYSETNARIKLAEIFGDFVP